MTEPPDLDLWRRRLPDRIPLFPLRGVLLLPRGRLPLNVFEPRYVAMVDDVMAAGRMIGIIQPADPADKGMLPRLYKTGCVGRVTRYEEQEDGRYGIMLTGIARFDLVDDAVSDRGYRIGVPDFSPYLIDRVCETGLGAERGRLIAALHGYFKLHGISADWGSINETEDERLVTSLSMICPFGDSEKQALLQAGGLVERAKILICLAETEVRMAACGHGGACH